MLKSYFIDFNKKIVKKASVAKSASTKGSAKKNSLNIDFNAFTEKLDGIIPRKLRVDSLKPVDSSGFSPDGTDLIVYSEYCRDIKTLLNGYIPYELIHGAFFLVNDLNKSSLADVFGRVATLKKINHFTDAAGTFNIPSFIITNNNPDYTLSEIKNDVINYCMSKNISSESEFEIIMIHNTGLLIKDWHKGDHRFIGLETGEDTMMWFFILMNEYLDVEREDVFDVRNYVRTEKSYNEF